MKKSGNQILVIGSSGHAKVVIDVIEQQEKYRILGLIDSRKPVGVQVFGYEILGGEEAISPLWETGKVVGGLIAIGDNWTRHLLAEKIRSLVPEFQFVSAVHPSAVIARGVTIGAGSVLMAAVVVNSDSQVGNFCILNTKASLDHDSVMHDFSSLAPQATTGGNVTIGAFSAVSLGAGLVHRLKIGEHSILGAGALAVDDIPDHCIAYGVPARVIRKRREGDKYL